MSSASEAVKFFLNRNWVTFALSLIAGFFTAVALAPAEWRKSIPFENNDWKTISTIVVASAVHYVLFSIIHWGYKIRQEVYGSGSVKVSLKPDIYTFLKEILEEEDSLTSEYRPVFDFNEDSKETN